MEEYAVPILPCRDLAASLRFYEQLGFENRGTPPQEWGYCIVARGRLVLHLISDPGVDPLATASSCYLYVRDADALQRAWADVIVPDPATGHRITDVEETPYGMREFAVVDPSGNLLRLGTPLPS